MDRQLLAVELFLAIVSCRGGRVVDLLFARVQLASATLTPCVSVYFHRGSPNQARHEQKRHRYQGIAIFMTIYTLIAFSLVVVLQKEAQSSDPSCKCLSHQGLLAARHVAN